MSTQVLITAEGYEFSTSLGGTTPIEVTVKAFTVSPQITASLQAIVDTVSQKRDETLSFTNDVAEMHEEVENITSETTELCNATAVLCEATQQSISEVIFYKGEWDASTGTYPEDEALRKGWTYKVSVSGSVSASTYLKGQLITYQGEGNWSVLYGAEASVVNMTEVGTSDYPYASVVQGDVINVPLTPTSVVFKVANILTDLHTYTYEGKGEVLISGGVGDVRLPLPETTIKDTLFTLHLEVTGGDDPSNVSTESVLIPQNQAYIKVVDASLLSVYNGNVNVRYFYSAVTTKKPVPFSPL
jgi:hypothetical protein